MLVGSIALWAFFVVVHASVVAVPRYDPFGTERFAWSVVFVASFLAGSYALGLPDLPRTRLLAIFSGLMAVAAALGVVSVGQLVLGRSLLPRVSMAGFATTLPLWGTICWNAGRDHASRAIDRAFFVGRHEELGALRTDLAGTVERDAEFVDSATLHESALGADGRQPLVEAFRRSHADVLVLDGPAQLDPGVVAQAATLHAGGARIRTTALFSEEYFGKVSVGELERMSLLFDIGELHRVRYTRLKRLVDLIIGVAATPFVAALVPLVVVANRFGNRGPLIYEQPRVGKSGETFMIYKFRTMVESDGSAWTTATDDRITPVGRWLRRTHLDELPQLWNILRGDLTLVGPRPEQPQYVDELEDKIPFFATRHLVRPGLTGWAQVNLPYASSESDAREKLQFDLYYLRRQSGFLDLRILVRTLRTVMLGGGR